ncbi:MAG: HlyD family type I secretion periplasmic adaptor subunit, partial [Hyphomicrobiales bacterium]
KEGDRVVKNQPLFRLQPAGPSSELGQIETRLARLRLEEIRLRAEADGTTPDFGLAVRKYPSLSSSQMAQYRANRHARLEEEAVLKARINQKQTDIDSAKREYMAIYEQLAAEEEKLNIQKVLLKDGYTSKQLYLNAKASYHRVLSEQIALQSRLSAARQSLKETKANLIKVRADAEEEIAVEMARVSGERAEAEQQVGKLKDRVNRLYVRAPVSGLVKQVVPKSTGAVVRPGEMLAEIVPTGQALVAEVHVKHKDIGHVKPGDPAEIKVTTFDPNRYGALHGSVKTISASSFKDEQGEPYFKATLGIDDSDYGNKPGHVKLSAGMVVNAEIVTDRKSLTRYLLKPIYRSIDTAFTER